MRSGWLAFPLLVACGGDDAPVAQADAVVLLDEDTTATFTLDGVDARGKEEDLTVSILEAPSDGSLSVEAGSAPLEVTYTPPADWSGATALSFTVTDADGVESAPRNVSLVVAAIDDDPLAVDDVVTTDSVTPIVVHPLDNDSDPEGDPIVLEGVGTPSSGTVAVEGAAAVRYTPDPSFSGVATFTYTARDADGGLGTATVTVTVTAGTAMTIDRFVALPTWPVTHQPILLVWETTGATSCTIDPDVDIGGAPSGTVSLVVEAQSTWVLTCQGPGGPVSAIVSVDPWPTDTDGDGLSDLGEIALGADPSTPDTDGDGLPDGAELETDATDADTDHDGWPDGIEDLDLDGLVDPGEFDPTDPDTDGDGVCDGPRTGTLPADPCLSPTVWYVDGDATGVANGTTWATAYRKVQQAISAADPGDFVFVAGGRYVGAAAALPLVTVEQMRIHIFGGFAGGEAGLADRPWPLEPTILDGDFDGDGMNPLDPLTVTDNATSIVRVTDAELTLDGFVVTGAKGRPDAGAVGTIPNIHAGLDGTRAIIRVLQSTISGNMADRGAAGGGDEVDLWLARTVVADNDGAGACLSFEDSDLSLTDALLTDNDLAVLSMTAGSLQVLRSRIARNPSGTGAFYLSNVHARLFDSEFVSNANSPSPCCNASALTVTGANGSLVAVDVSFVGNTGGYGAISVTDAPATLTNVTFVGNVPTANPGPTRGGAITSCNATVAVRNALFQTNGTTDVQKRNCTAGLPVVTSSLSNLPLGSGNTLASNVATALPSGEVVLVDASAGVGAGQAAVANDPDLGYPAFGAVWSQRTATKAFTPDAPPIDVGRHFPRDRTVIHAFGVDASSAWWDVSGARQCELFTDGDPVIVLDQPTTGDAPHGGSAADEVLLTCDSTWGDRATEAAASVP